MVDLNLLTGTVSDGGGDHAFADPTDANDGNAGTGAVRNGNVRGAGTTTSILETDLGGLHWASGMVIVGNVGGIDMNWTSGLQTRATLFQGSNDGSSWTSIAHTEVWDGANTTTVTFDDSEEWQWFRIRISETQASGLQAWGNIDIRTWEITEGDPVGPEEPDPSDPGEDEEYEDPEPPGVFLEIYVSPEDSYRWDVAEWDEAVWSAAAWTDVTPEGISVTIRDGVDRADQGILARVVAADWTVTTYDPDRRLDPANPGGPWYPEIVPGLPIRLSYRSAVIAQGTCLRITYRHGIDEGEIRATDSLFPLRAATVPEDAILPDTLFARTRAVLAAVGREDIVVGRDPSGGDIPLSPWDLGTNDSAWHIIEESAREVLWFPTVGTTGAIFFRAWADPSDRGKVIGSPNMEDLTVTTQDEGVVSVVRVNDDISDTTIERRITPLPRYGERVHERTRLTIDGPAYADAVLFDRGAASVRWVPGDVHAFTADDVEYFARIGPGEVVSIDYPEADPPLEVRARVLGRTLHVIGSNSGPGTNRSKWWWRYHASVEAAEPLAADDELFTIWLTSDDGDGYLYPDGVIALT